MTARARPVELELSSRSDGRAARAYRRLAAAYIARRRHFLSRQDVIKTHINCKTEKRMDGPRLAEASGAMKMALQAPENIDSRDGNGAIRGRRTSTKGLRGSTRRRDSRSQRRHRFRPNETRSSSSRQGPARELAPATKRGPRSRSRLGRAACLRRAIDKLVPGGPPGRSVRRRRHHIVAMDVVQLRPARLKDGPVHGRRRHPKVLRASGKQKGDHRHHQDSCHCPPTGRKPAHRTRSACEDRDGYGAESRFRSPPSYLTRRAPSTARRSRAPAFTRRRA